MLSLFLRGWLQVSLVALNTVQISQHRYPGAFAVGFLISLVWWQNAHSAGTQGRLAGLVYALGAACGTVTGMWIGGWGG